MIRTDNMALSRSPCRGFCGYGATEHFCTGCYQTKGAGDNNALTFSQDKLSQVQRTSIEGDAWDSANSKCIIKKRPCRQPSSKQCNNEYGSA